ncbi:hypothetical protein GY45DRAFT_1341428 [Cubamyces sp. BRFM 1775]|nr:hypothetical protein GY45DRAFT_1341428 [Cubamyces sp. BRFM 1775]
MSILGRPEVVGAMLLHLFGKSIDMIRPQLDNIQRALKFASVPLLIMSSGSDTISNPHDSSSLPAGSPGARTTCTTANTQNLDPMVCDTSESPSMTNAQIRQWVRNAACRYSSAAHMRMSMPFDGNAYRDFWYEEYARKLKKEERRMKHQKLELAGPDDETDVSTDSSALLTPSDRGDEEPMDFGAYVHGPDVTLRADIPSSGVRAPSAGTFGSRYGQSGTHRSSPNPTRSPGVVLKMLRPHEEEKVWQAERSVSHPTAYVNSVDTIGLIEEMIGSPRMYDTSTSLYPPPAS